MLEVLEIVVAAVSFMMGACVYSFLNVVIDRVPRGMSFVKGHSICMNCERKLAPLDLVPVFSWIFLRGRCRYCKAPIPARFTVVELLGGIFALVVLHRFGFTPEGLVTYGFFSILTVVALVDWDTMEIPNGFVLAILVLAVLRLLLMETPPYLNFIIGFFAVSLPLFLITLIIPGAFGGGDIKLMAACGLYMGWGMTLLSFFFAVLGGGGYGIYLLISHRKGKGEHFPFGPFLCAGMFIALMWGAGMLNWYLNLFIF